MSGDERYLEATMVDRAKDAHVSPKMRNKRVRVWICGLPGAGKTTLAKRVSRILSVAHHDSDQLDISRFSTCQEVARYIEDSVGQEDAVVSCVAPSLGSDWLVVFVDASVIKCMHRRPGAYDLWLTGKSEGIRAIDTWRPPDNPSLVLLEGEAFAEETASRVAATARRRWCTT